MIICGERLRWWMSEVKRLVDEINKIEKFLSSIDYSIQISNDERVLLYDNAAFQNKRLETLRNSLVYLVCQMYKENKL